MQQETYWIDNLYNDTFTFNDLAGNTTRLSLRDIKSQTKLIIEETNELNDAVEANDPVKVLDGVTDILVVVSGLASKLLALGFDVSTAFEQTAKNNLSKFPRSEKTAISTVDAFKQQGIETTAEYNASHDRWVIRDENGKVRKPIGFVSNDLSNCIPEGFTKFAG